MYALTKQLDSWPVAVVCPVSVRSVWAEQFAQYLPPGELLTVVQNKKSRITGSVIIISSQVAVKRAAELQQYVRMIIVDESHIMKNPGTKVTKQNKTKRNSFVF